MAGASTLTRRASEFLGVALFAAAVLLIVALVTYEPNDPAWFFSTGATHAPANFAGLVGAFLAEASFQVFGYTAYLVPAALVVLGWHYFWCRQVDAIYTKVVGVVLLFASLSGLLALAIGTLDFGGHAFRTGGGVGELIARLSAAYLNRAGSIIVLLTLLFMSVILATQFSFGRLFAWLMQAAAEAWRRGFAALREWRENRRREQQRREVIAKHAKRTGVKPEELQAERPAVAPVRRAGAELLARGDAEPAAPVAGPGEGRVARAAVRPTAGGGSSGLRRTRTGRGSRGPRARGGSSRRVSPARRP